MKTLLHRVLANLLRPLGVPVRAYLRHRIASDPAIREWVWAQDPSLRMVLGLGLHEYPEDW